MSIDLAVEALARGMVIGVPTDTVYGVAADPHSAVGVAGVFDLKGRAGDAPLVVLVADVDSARGLVSIPDDAAAAVDPFWPGPLTGIFETIIEFPEGVGDSERGTLAVRVPGDPLLAELLAVWGPLAVTSANRSGEPPAENDVEARQIFGAQLPVYLPGGGGGTASTVVNFTTDPWMVLRQGPVSLADLKP